MGRWKGWHSRFCLCWHSLLCWIPSPLWHLIVRTKVPMLREYYKGSISISWSICLGVLKSLLWGWNWEWSSGASLACQLSPGKEGKQWVKQLNVPRRACTQTETKWLMVLFIPNWSLRFYPRTLTQWRGLNKTLSCSGSNHLFQTIWEKSHGLP